MTQTAASAPTKTRCQCGHAGHFGNTKHAFGAQFDAKDLVLVDTARGRTRILVCPACAKNCGRDSL